MAARLSKIAEALANDACEEQIVVLLSLIGSENMDVLLSIRVQQISLKLALEAKIVKCRG